MIEDMLRQKITALRGYSFSKGKEKELGKIQDILGQSSDWQLFRINPLRFAEEHSLDKRFCIEFFVHSAKLGLFDFDWNVLCPGCGGIEHSAASASQIQQDIFRCTICNIDVAAELDSQIEVAFTINPGVRKITINPFESFDSYRRFFFSSNYERSSELHDYSKDHFVSFMPLTADASGLIRFQAEPGCLYRLLSMVSHSQMFIHVSDGPAAKQVLEANIGELGFMTRELEIQPGPVELQICNRTKHENAATLLKTDFQLLHDILLKNPNKRKPFLTGTMLFNNQSFRDLFRVQTLAKDLSLRVRSLSVLFTDLKGSTAMYERVGDFDAYRVVQQHFAVLAAAINKHDGAVVKTMGDAVMATFCSPLDAIQAAVEMLESVTNFNNHLVGEQSVGLKIGLHEGPALTVNADERLDYFGQTINIAARVQHLSGSGELWFTDSILSNAQVQSFLHGKGLSLSRHSANLSGIQNEVTVYQCCLH